VNWSGYCAQIQVSTITTYVSEYINYSIRFESYATLLYTIYRVRSTRPWRAELSIMRLGLARYPSEISTSHYILRLTQHLFRNF
jgi:hypothetical protein